MNTKICIDCNQEKPLEQFNKQAKSKDKHGSYCKDCANARALKWRLDNIEHRAEYRKIYNKENAEVVRERTQDWRDRNRPRVRQLGKEFYEANPERNLCYDAKKRAKRFDVPFSITHEDIVIPEFCPVLGIKLERGKGKLTDNSPTLDRIDPQKGYVVGNIAVISHRANRLKSDGTVAEHEKVTSWLKNQF